MGIVHPCGLSAQESLRFQQEQGGQKVSCFGGIAAGAPLCWGQLCSWGHCSAPAQEHTQCWDWQQWDPPVHRDPQPGHASTPRNTKTWQQFAQLPFPQTEPSPSQENSTSTSAKDHFLHLSDQKRSSGFPPPQPSPQPWKRRQGHHQTLHKHCTGTQDHQLSISVQSWHQHREGSDMSGPCSDATKACSDSCSGHGNVL